MLKPVLKSSNTKLIKKMLGNPYPNLILKFMWKAVNQIYECVQLLLLTSDLTELELHNYFCPCINALDPDTEHDE